MFFSSLVAENANRRNRLVFQTPPPIPAHPIAEHELKRFPSWKTDKEVPFGSTITPTLRQSWSGLYTFNTDSTDPLYEGDEEVSVATCNELASNRNNNQRPQIAKRTHTVDSIASINLCSYSQKALVKTARNFAAPAGPMPTVFLPGCALMLMFNPLSGIPLRRCAQPLHKNNVPIAMSVGLMGNSKVEAKNERSIPLARRLSRKFSGISRVEVPQSPFDPFGTTKESPLERAAIEEEAKLGTLHGRSNKNDVNAVGAEAIVTEGSFDAGNESDNEALARDSQQVDLFSESEELGELPTEFQIETKSSSAVPSSSSNNPAESDLFVPNPVSGQRLSNGKVERLKCLGHDGVQPNISSSAGLVSLSSTPLGQDISDDGKADGHVSAESQINATSQVLSIETGRSTRSAENYSSFGPSASTLATQGLVQKDKKGQIKPHRRVSTRLRQAMMTRFRKFAHPKRN